uniref:Uncharacterized protein n=1 Tax=Tanacetum cinerariifolium TaxID=118510 RepID=A0A6L2NBG9_TANCI|nr:hypothetical protein [Tanacetum cinerariifolium]
MEQAAILREIVKQAKSLNLLDSASYSACKYVKLIQELLGYVKDTCHDIHKPSEKLVVVTPINKKKIVRFAEPIISSSTSQKKLGSFQTKTKQTTNNYVTTSTGVSQSTKSSRSKCTDNTKNDRILQISSSNQKKNKVEDHSRIIKSCLNKPNYVVEPSRNAHVQHSKLNTNSELICVKCNSIMFDARHELYFLEFVSDMNASSKSKSVKKSKKKEEWKPIGKVITTTNKVPLREPIPLEEITQESVVTMVYTRRPKVVQIVLWYLDFRCSKHMTRDRSQLTNFVHNFLGTVKVDNDQIAKIVGYGDYQIRNIIISMVYYVEGLGYNLFSIGQFYDLDLEVAFRKHTCFVRNLKDDEAPDFIIKFIKMIQVRLHTPVRNIRTDNRTEFVNQTLRSYYESVSISHETSVARSPQQNVANALRAVDLADSPVSTSIDQDALSTNPSRSVVTRKQLHIDAMWCYFDAFLTSAEPKNFKQAMTKPPWIDAMQEEIHESERLQVWELVSCPDKVMLIKLKWIYKVKTNEFGGVVRIEAIHIFVANAANKNMMVFQMDVKTAFLYGELNEGVYVSEPEGFVDQDNPSHVYKLKKALYGLKQAQRSWYDMLSSFLISQHFSIDTFMVENNKLDKDLQGTPIDATLYHGMIGSFMYLTSSRPDRIYAVCLCALHQAKPTEKHLNAIKRIFRYLKGTINMGLWYSKDTVGLPRSKRALRSRVQRLNILPYLGVVLKSYGCVHS